MRSGNEFLHIFFGEKKKKDAQQLYYFQRCDEVSGLQRLSSMMDDRLKNERLLKAKIFEKHGNAQCSFLYFITRLTKPTCNRAGLLFFGRSVHLFSFDQWVGLLGDRLLDVD